MHQACKEYMDTIKLTFPQYFEGKNVLDVGSQDINGNNRYLFKDCNYVGIDLGPGRNVDVVSHVKDFETGYQFDTIISTNAFEHDEFFSLSIDAICNRLLKPNGLFVFSCASDGTPEHGTTYHFPGHSPHTNHWYQNLTEHDVRKVIDCDSIFSIYTFHVHGVDLRFNGKKKSI